MSSKKAKRDMRLDFAQAYSKLCSDILLYTVKLEYSDGTEEIIYYNYVGHQEAY